jgi:hypothetical protein
MILSSINPKGSTTRTQAVCITGISLIRVRIRRDFMTRTERYHRGLTMINRIFQLQESHNWSNQDTATAFASLDEFLPINLHNIGMYIRWT